MARTAMFPMIFLACGDRSKIQDRTESPSMSPNDSAFALVQIRGHRAMGVDQYTSTHRFEALPDGGRISLVRDIDDPTGAARIRAHMAEIAAAFRRGDFTVPGFVHGRAVPGTAIMAARRSQIGYTTDTLPGGASLRIYSTDSIAILAIQQFLAFQRQDHRSPHADTTR
jgi:hypothetical protein